MGIGKWVALGITLPAIIGVASLAANLLSAPVQVANMATNSALGVVGKTLDPNNVITKYEYFHDAYAVFLTRQAQVKQTQRDLDAEKDPAEKARLRVELNGQRSVCMKIANDYNANATKTNVSIFQGREAPPSLSAAACG